MGTKRKTERIRYTGDSFALKEENKMVRLTAIITGAIGDGTKENGGESS